MQIQFDKYQGAGNDFIIIDNRTGSYEILSEKELDLLCDRHKGIGADGVILIQNHKELDFEMRYFNADGNLSSMCGNGGRCAVAFAHRHKIIEKSTRFMAVDGVHQATLISPIDVRLQMQDVSGIIQNGKTIIIDTGSPHLVLLLDDIQAVDVKKEGATIRYSEAFKKEGINVNFIEKKGNALFDIRTYERGVENETLACGTGAVAAAIAMHHISKSKEKVTKFILNALGGKLTIDFEVKERHYSNVFLQGPATYIFSGSIAL
jgi:diaminopimelate epimerase|tara:strand:+ start:855 stop:1643 length:789 start_codon:yes stop_codon:yes gene_type:complete